MKNELKILGKNGNLYSLEEYLKLQGNTYHYAVGIIFESPIIGKRVLAFDSWKEKWANEEKNILNVYQNQKLFNHYAVQIIQNVL